jgi:type II secretory pathway pseudopilin PulG
MKKLNKKGFSVVEIILIIVIVGIIGGVGWYVWQSRAKNDSTAAADYAECVKTKGAKLLLTVPEKCVVNGQSFTKPTQGTAKTTPTPTKVQKQYLEIKELGIKFELTDNLKDAYYFVNKDGGVYVSVHHFDGLSGFEGCTAAGSSNIGGGLAAVYYVKVGDEHFGTPWTQEELNKTGAVKIDDKYFMFEPNSQAPCWDANKFTTSDSNVKLFQKLKAEIMGRQKTITRI